MSYTNQQDPQTGQKRITMSKKVMTITIVTVAGPVFMALTSPDSLPLYALAVPFVWVLAMTAFVAHYVLKLAGFTAKKRLSLAMMLAVTVTLLLVFQSIHQLTVRDLVLSVSLAGCVVFYLSRVDFL